MQVDSPQQANACDCGFFAVLNAEHVVGWMRAVLSRPQDMGAGESSLSTVSEGGTALSIAPFAKGDAGALRSIAFQALAEDWWSQFDRGEIEEEEGLRRVERQERESIPDTLIQQGCMYEPAHMPCRVNGPD